MQNMQFFPVCIPLSLAARVRKTDSASFDYMQMFSITLLSLWSAELQILDSFFRVDDERKSKQIERNFYFITFHRTW